MFVWVYSFFMVEFIIVGNYGMVWSGGRCRKLVGMFLVKIIEGDEIVS